MGEYSFHELNRQLFKLYEEKEFAQVLALIAREEASFPERDFEFSYWRICMTNLLGRQAEALQLFRSAIEQGFWFSPDWTASDEDLISLHPSAEFQELLALCHQRLAEAQANAHPELLVIPSTLPSKSQPLLIALHGNQGNIAETSEWWRPASEDGWLLALSQSSQIAGQNAYVWNDRERGISEVSTYFSTLQQDFTIDPERVVLGGFSKGGGLAVWMALQQSIHACGFLVGGPALTDEEFEALSALLSEQKLTGIRGYIFVGAEDRLLDAARKLTEIMHTHGLGCELEVRPGLKHEYPVDFGEVISRGLAFIVEGR